MTRRALAGSRGEDGMALVSALAILLVILGLGSALLAYSNGQQRAGANQQQSESAFSLAEAALNAQIYRLSLQWPTSNDQPVGGYPAGCNAASNGASYCPSPSDLSAAYPTSSQTCQTGTPHDAWSNSPASNGWTTYVRDAGAGGSSTQQVFNSSVEQSQQLAYDSSASGFVWVRAVGTVNCRTAVVVAKVANQVVGLTLPNTVLDANGFELSNNGNHDTRTILNTQGSSPSAGQVSVRCGGNPGTTYPPSCVTMDNSSQFGPTSPSSSTSWMSPPVASRAFTPQQLQAAKELAISVGRYYPAGTDCSKITDMSQLSGEVVFFDGGTAGSPCNLGVSNVGGANDNSNSATTPGLLVIVNGTIKFTGSGTFYGVIYDANTQGCPDAIKNSSVCPYGPTSSNDSDVVVLGGTSSVVGGVDIDGGGTASLGSAGNGVVVNGVSQTGDLIYNSSIFPLLQGYGGAAATPNTFRQLPITQ